VGTRGLTGFVVGGTEYLQYQQCDSYPSGVGIDVLKWLKNANLERVVEQAKALKLIDPESTPTAEQIKACAPWTNLGVSEGKTSDWYCLVRETQGDPQAILDCGYVRDASDFALDSLFCEWAWVIDLDRAVFQAYEGFQKAPHAEGRFADRVISEPELPYPSSTSRYWPIKLKAEWSLERLPTDEEFLALEASDDEG
jgi:hypothetical protein